MPVIETQQNIIGSSGFDAATFLALAQDPKAFSAKLAQLQTATDAAKAAQCDNEEAIQKLVKATEIDALLKQSREDAVISKKAIADAQAQASVIVLNAQTEATRIIKDASDKAAIVRVKLEEEGKRADERANELVERAKIIEAEIATAKAAQAAANELAVAAKSAQAEAKTAKDAAVAKITFITTSFNAFVAAVKG